MRFNGHDREPWSRRATTRIFALPVFFLAKAINEHILYSYDGITHAKETESSATKSDDRALLHLIGYAFRERTTPACLSHSHPTDCNKLDFTSLNLLSNSNQHGIKRESSYNDGLFRQRGIQVFLS